MPSSFLGLAAAAAMAAAFPAVQRPVADIVSPTWGDAATRDAADEVGQIAARLAIRPGMTVGRHRRRERLRHPCVSRKLWGRVARSSPRTSPASYLASLRASLATAGPAQCAHRGRATPAIHGSRRSPSIGPSWSTCITRSPRPYALLYHLAGEFRPGGRLGIEELDRPTQNHGTPPKLLTCELNAAGYRTVSLAPLKGGIGYFAVFAAPPAPVAVDTRAGRGAVGPDRGLRRL